MKKYLIALDMDGTLLNSEGVITQNTIEVLQELLDAGHFVVPATGRALTLLPEEILNLRGKCFAILENGSVIWNFKKNCVLKKYLIPKGVISSILQDIDKNIKTKYYVEVFADGKAYARQEDMKQLSDAKIEGNFIEYMLNDHIFVERLLEKTQLLNETEKMNIYFEDEVISKKVREKWSKISNINVTTSVKGNAEFNAIGINKGTGLIDLMKELNLEKEQIIAIGDNENDLDMFDRAGLSVAMGNSKNEIKKKADIITDDNNHEGVLNFLKKYFNI